jgi:hypothetical protein
MENIMEIKAREIKKDDFYAPEINEEIEDLPFDIIFPDED